MHSGVTLTGNLGSNNFGDLQLYGSLAVIPGFQIDRTNIVIYSGVYFVAPNNQITACTISSGTPIVNITGSGVMGLPGLALAVGQSIVSTAGLNLTSVMMVGSTKLFMNGSGSLFISGVIQGTIITNAASVPITLGNQIATLAIYASQITGTTLRGTATGSAGTLTTTNVQLLSTLSFGGAGAQLVLNGASIISAPQSTLSPALGIIVASGDLNINGASGTVTLPKLQWETTVSFKSVLVAPFHFTSVLIRFALFVVVL